MLPHFCGQLRGIARLPSYARLRRFPVVAPPLRCGLMRASCPHPKPEQEQSKSKRSRHPCRRCSMSCGSMLGLDLGVRAPARIAASRDPAGAKTRTNRGLRPRCRVPVGIRPQHPGASDKPLGPERGCALLACMKYCLQPCKVPSIIHVSQLCDAIPQGDRNGFVDFRV